METLETTVFGRPRQKHRFSVHERFRGPRRSYAVADPRNIYIYMYEQ